ncbi:hypothetical protein O6H91_11G075700 [Diphasiastrum complanatum]|uniref:Uncharacterized protein n=1 Tax=Diphasiastrum complanatum TaxID=34168 RepID=A0ACC2CAS2_DIPCM|nr:hypothetical protein O6H91_11G075700 [Diphasiastrum complanatum]
MSQLMEPIHHWESIHLRIIFILLISYVPHCPFVLPTIHALALRDTSIKSTTSRVTTDPVQVATLNTIKSSYNLQTDWSGDPCFPMPWHELNCSSGTPAAVTSLDLSNAGLVGPFSPAFGELLTLVNLYLENNKLSGSLPSNMAALSSLEVLNLSSNSLTGSVPDFQSLQSLTILDLKDNNFNGPIPDRLGTLPKLEILNLENNNLSGFIPSSLVKQKLHLLSSGNPCLGFPSNECDLDNSIAQSNAPPLYSKRPAIINVIIGLASVSLVVLIVIGWIIYLKRRRKQKRNLVDCSQVLTYNKAHSGHNIWIKAKQFSWNQMNVATNHFTKELGKGSFGPVYFGRLPNGQEIAVKVRSDESKLGADSFQNEVHLLSRVHHSSLVSLLGFCEKPKQQLLVYEYMPNGPLQDHLYGSRSKGKKPLSWKTRLQIAIGAATGLEYLHNHSNPKIIHRDVKSSNILLDASMNAKVADFGFSKDIKNLDVSHVTTVIKGTAGYLDPEYYASNQLTEKSDVYSFGVVLLEMICGREPLSHWVSPDEYNLLGWARPLLKVGAFDKVVDKCLLGDFTVQSMQIVGHLAAQCTERMRPARPTMQEVLKELQVALSLEEAD